MVTFSSTRRKRSMAGHTSAMGNGTSRCDLAAAGPATSSSTQTSRLCRLGRTVRRLVLLHQVGEADVAGQHGQPAHPEVPHDLDAVEQDGVCETGAVGHAGADV